ncbi:peroxisomal membrane protein 11B-like [Apostichopus japonicus]|uniref:peroxisomal membrane protein 11B-like n=1 Tax=Stichopus japonicus TaxID=307972 RepID=UPI003AB8A242
MTSKEGVRTGTGFTSSFIKYMSYTDGRDKVNRTVQYGARFILWYFDRYGGVLSTIQKVQNLESALTSSRKLFRMARTLDFLQKALDALGKKDETEKALEVLGYLFKAIWLFSDHLIWFGKIKLIQIDTKQWGQRSAWCWLAANSTLAARDLYKLQQLIIQAEELKQSGNSSHRGNLPGDMQKVKLQLAVDLCDILIPLASLGYINKGLGAAGGVTSSLIGGYLVWEKNIGSK